MVKVEESRFMGAKEVSEIIGVSLSKAYSIIRQLNNELHEKGKITVPGKISRKYFEEKIYA